MTCTRVSDESLVDLLFDAGSADDRAHVAGCADCGGRLQPLEATLVQVRSADLPEPSPFYWSRLRQDVRGRISQIRGWRWAPLAAAAASLVFALAVVSGNRTMAVPGERVLPAWAALPPASDDTGLVVIEGLLSSGPDQDDLGGCNGLAPCLASLNEAETQVLIETLRAEMKGVDS
jgi:hypothetical protein